MDYSLLVPFIDNYYKISEIKSAQKLTEKVSEKYSDRLNYFSSLSADLQYGIGEEIITEIERYRTLIEAVLANEDSEILEEKLDEFISSTQAFIFLYGEYDYYTTLYDIVDGYYISKANYKAQKIALKILSVYKKRLNVFINLSDENKFKYSDQIKNEILDFRYFIEMILLNDKSEFSENIEIEYNSIVNEFKK